MQGTGDIGLKTFLANASRDPSILDHSKNLESIIDELGRKILSFLFQPEDEVDTTKPLSEMGMDSLVIIEIRNWWCQTFELEISVMEFMNGRTIERLANLAVNGLRGKFASRV